jgi:hypothetical protein
MTLLGPSPALGSGPPRTAPSGRRPGRRPATRRMWYIAGDTISLARKRIAAPTQQPACGRETRRPGSYCGDCSARPSWAPWRPSGHNLKCGVFD